MQFIIETHSNLGAKDLHECQHHRDGILAKPHESCITLTMKISAISIAQKQAQTHTHKA